MSKTAPAVQSKPFPNWAPGPGRPSSYTPEVADEICARLVNGEFLTDICKDPRIPAVSSVQRWTETNPSFRAAYAKARKMQAQYWVERGVQEVVITDDPKLVNRARLRFHAFRTYGGLLDPDNWGDRSQSGANVVVNVNGAERVTASKRVLLASLDDLAAGAHLIEGTAEEVPFEG